jgi:hypothetical protein
LKIKNIDSANPSNGAFGLAIFHWAHGLSICCIKEFCSLVTCRRMTSKHPRYKMGQAIAGGVSMPMKNICLWGTSSQIGCKEKRTHQPDWDIPKLAGCRNFRSSIIGKKWVRKPEPRNHLDPSPYSNLIWLVPSAIHQAGDWRHLAGHHESRVTGGGTHGTKKIRKWGLTMKKGTLTPNN